MINMRGLILRLMREAALKPLSPSMSPLQRRWHQEKIVAANWFSMTAKVLPTFLL
jgi:hypothetical protein